MTYISSDHEVGEPRFGHVWRDEKGALHATLYISSTSATAFFFDSSQDARDIAAACLEVAEKMDAFAATNQPGD